jgi:hypothetical protein
MRGKRLVRLLGVVAVLVAAVLVGAGEAFAGSVSIIDAWITYTAAPGETNQVTISEPAQGVWRVADAAAPVVAGSGCISVNPHEANCLAPNRGDLVIEDQTTETIRLTARSLPETGDGISGEFGGSARRSLLPTESTSALALIGLPSVSSSVRWPTRPRYGPVAAKRLSSKLPLPNKSEISCAVTAPLRLLVTALGEVGDPVLEESRFRPGFG